MKDSLRILIVEDSTVVAMLLKALLDHEPDMQVIGIAKDGRQGVEMARSLRPDLITMDIRMPEMDGFLATREIMATCPVPIVVISSSVDAEELRITFRAIEEGALAVLEKPHGIGHPDFSTDRQTIVETVRAMAEVKVVRRTRSAPPPAAPERYQPPPARNYELLALGCSTGGPQVLHALLARLPADFPLPIVVVQHIAPGFVAGMAGWLDQDSPFRVRVAGEGQRLDPGEVLLAGDGRHLKIRRDSKGDLRVAYDDGPPEHFQKPSASALLRSVAEVAGERAVAGILTGMGDDGAPGLGEVHKRGGLTFVQAPASCVVASMPQNAIALGAADYTLDMDAMVPFLAAAAAGPSRTAVS